MVSIQANLEDLKQGIRLQITDPPLPAQAT